MNYLFLARTAVVHFIFVFFALAVFKSADAKTFFGGGSYSRRGSNENVRWTLADWMDQKKQFRLMDQWLALHRQRNLFEFNIEGGQVKYDLTVGGNITEQTLNRYSASLYISIFGLEGGYEESNEDTKSTWGQFNVRVFGTSSQSSHLVASYGARKRENEKDATSVTNQYGAVKLQLYLVDFLGLDGTYRKYLNARDNLGHEYGGERAEYGLFLEYSFVRLFGRAFQERTYITRTDGTTAHELRDGVDAGIKFFF